MGNCLKPEKVQDDDDIGGNIMESHALYPDSQSSDGGSDIPEEMQQYTSTEIEQKPIHHRLNILSIISAVFVMVLGTLSHFTFDWYGCSETAFYAGFMPVNESVWEHMKMSYWPIVLFALIEFYFIRNHSHHVFLSKFVIFVVAAMIPTVGFYIYTIWAHHNWIVDSILFYCGVITGHYLGHHILKKPTPLPFWVAIVSALLMVVCSSIFIAFTYHPPNAPIFIDENSNMAGIHCGDLDHLHD
eukprot:31001_1